MKYCPTCVQPDTRPGAVFNADGVCPACENHANFASELDFELRYELLQEMLAPYRSNCPGAGFDSIMGVSGGKDSTRQALWARDHLGLNPLLACLTYPPEQVTQRGTDNLSNLIELGFDVVISGPGPQTWKALLRQGFLSFTNWAKFAEQALISSVPQLAVKYGIELILWGENPGLQLGDLKTIGRNGFDGNNLRYGNTVDGGRLDLLRQAGFADKELIPYRHPTVDEFEAANLQIIYLGWAWSDWSLYNNAMYAVAEGLEIRSDSVENTGDLGGVSALDEDWVTLNQMIKYYKYGFGRVSDYLNEELRLGRMSRSHAIELAEKYDGACSDEYIKLFCDYIDITTEFFWEHVRKSVNKELFDVRADGDIVPKFKVGVGL